METGNGGKYSFLMASRYSQKVEKYDIFSFTPATDRKLFCHFIDLIFAVKSR